MKRNQIIILFVFIGLFGFVLAGCLALVGGAVLLGSGDSGDRIVTDEEFGFADVDEWEQSGVDPFVDLDLPPSARNVQLLSGGFQDPYYLLRASFDPDELDLVANADGCGGLLPQDESRQLQSFTNTVWWVPASATIYQSCVGYEHPGYSQNVAIDQSDPDEFILYVQGISF